jgi:hypothetical protein
MLVNFGATFMTETQASDQWLGIFHRYRAMALNKLVTG